MSIRCTTDCRSCGKRSKRTGQGEGCRPFQARINRVCVRVRVCVTRHVRFHAGHPAHPLTWLPIAFYAPIPSARAPPTLMWAHQQATENTCPHLASGDVSVHHLSYRVRSTLHRHAPARGPDQEGSRAIGEGQVTHLIRSLRARRVRPGQIRSAAPCTHGTQGGDNPRPQRRGA